MKIAIPDLISNSYFPVIAAVQLGYFESDGLDMQLELLFPVTRAMHALHDGQFDFVAGAAHATLGAFPRWAGATGMSLAIEGAAQLAARVRPVLRATETEIDDALAAYSAERQPAALRAVVSTPPRLAKALTQSTPRHGFLSSSSGTLCANGRRP
jgi:hypothetical protein